MYKPTIFVPVIDMPTFIKDLIQALSFCEDVNEETIVNISQRLWHSPRTARQLTEFVEIGYCNNQMVLSECERIERLTGRA